MNYSQLLTDNTRSDDYVNASKLCKAFGKEWFEFSRKAQTKRLMDKIESTGKTPVQKPNRRETFIHPLLVVALAEWLSPDFHMVVLETFKRYLEGDVTLATEIVNRSTDKAAVQAHIEEATVHVTYLDSYHGLTDEMKLHGCSGIHYGTVNKHINTLAGVEKGQRNSMTRRQKLTMTIAQASGELALMNDNKCKGWGAVNIVKRATSHALSPAK